MPKEVNQTPLTADQRLRRIARIIWDVDTRCMAADGDVIPTLQEMTQAEISEIYELASSPLPGVDENTQDRAAPAGFECLSREEMFIAESIVAARKIQTLLWGEANGSWGLEEWRRMFIKRYVKIDMIDPANPHAVIELKKRLLQNAALSIALTAILHFSRPLDIVNDKIPSNLPGYADVYSRPECPFKYCDDPDECRSAGRCRHRSDMDSDQ